MQVTVKFFASLRERVGHGETALPATDVLTVAEVWERATDGAPAPPNTLAAINLEYASWEHPVHPGDEVAFFPPVTGG